MKFFNIFLLAIALFIGLIYFLNPQVFRIIRHQKPYTDTYTHFPQRSMEPSDQPFHFPKGNQSLWNLDTLRVRNGRDKHVPFSQYFEEGQLKAFLVIQQDTLVYEKYGGGYTKETLSNTFSIGKSMLSVLAGKAMEEGYIQSLDQKVADLIPEIKDHTSFVYMTVDHLLQMKSGLQFTRTGDGVLSDLFSDEARFYYTKSLKKDLLKVSSDTLAGLRWKYSNLDPLFLTWAIEAAVGRKASDYFEEKIWKPIGAEYEASWGIDQIDGLENSPSSFQCTAIDLAKIGRLYLNLGTREGKTILPPAWVAYSLTLRPENTLNATKGWQKSTHQNYWWIPQEGREGDYAAEGLRGQRLYVHPATKTIIVQFAERGGGGYPYRKIAHYFWENRKR